MPDDAANSILLNLTPDELAEQKHRYAVAAILRERANNLLTKTFIGWCQNCGHQGLMEPLNMREGATNECQVCGDENWEPFRVGWDESD